jgi:hypothetical protein
MELASRLPWLTTPSRVKGHPMTTSARLDRRAPDRHLVAVRLLRRIAVLALVLSVLLLAVPRGLVELGLLGPSAEEVVASAEASLRVARSYGATAALPAFEAAERELESARQAARGGDGREARRAAARAEAHAVEAQRVALASESASQRRALAVYTDLDRQINDLEKLYSAAAPGLQKQQISELLSVMKVTRATAGAVFLAYEQQDYEAVLANEGRARTAVVKARDYIQALK